MNPPKLDPETLRWVASALWDLRIASPSAVQYRNDVLFVEYDLKNLSKQLRRLAAQAEAGGVQKRAKGVSQDEQADKEDRSVRRS